MTVSLTANETAILKARITKRYTAMTTAERTEEMKFQAELLESATNHDDTTAVDRARLRMAILLDLESGPQHRVFVKALEDEMKVNPGTVDLWSSIRRLRQEANRYESQGKHYVAAAIRNGIDAQIAAAEELDFEYRLKDVDDEALADMIQELYARNATDWDMNREAYTARMGAMKDERARRDIKAAKAAHPSNPEPVYKCSWCTSTAAYVGANEDGDFYCNNHVSRAPGGLNTIEL